MGSAKNRYLTYGLLLLGMFLILIFNLAKLTIVEGEKYLELSENRKRKVVAVQGTRGSILDRNGLPLAYDEKSYNVTVVKDPNINSTSARAYYSDIFIDAINIVEKYGGEPIDSFVVKKDDRGNFYFDFGISNVEARKKREVNWRKNMFVGFERTPEEIYVELRARFLIPQEYSYEDSRKLLSIWQEVQLSSYRAYVPVIIAQNVDIYTVSEVETRANELEGVSVQEGTIRTYVQDDVAAHSIGYLGKINTAEVGEKMVKKGYDLDDLIGLSGVEASLEDVLTGNSTERQGTQDVEIDSRGAITKVFTSTPAKQGNSVMLTIDLQLQMAVEESLERNIATIYEEQLKVYNHPLHKIKYDKQVLEKPGSDNKQLDLADSGAAVVLDVTNGDVLAIASYPSYDLNLFTGGISETNYRSLSEDKSNPLFNKAVYTKATPGSVFKMATGIGALMAEPDKDGNKLTLNTRINDVGYYTKYVQRGKSVKCWGWPVHAHLHQHLDMAGGLANSCNYFFYTSADWQGIDNLNYWSERLGLIDKTGIELFGEPAGQVGNQKVLYDNTRSVYNQDTSIPFLVHRLIRQQLSDIAEFRNVEYTDDVIFETESKLLRVAGVIDEETGLIKTQTGPEIRQILSDEMSISITMSRQRLWDRAIASIMSELQWNPNMTLVTGIGQGVTSVTPLALARYVAACVNGGTVFNVHIVDKILSPEGEIIEETEPSVFGTLDDVPDEYLDVMKKGMRDVITKGTAAPYFAGFEYSQQMGGKTGTAEVSQIDLENNSLFVAFAPYEEPEIAIVVFVPNGYQGGYNAWVAQDIVQFYLDKKKEAAPENIPEINDIIS